MRLRPRPLALVSTLLAVRAFAAAPAAPATPLTPEEILRKVKAPPEFTATVFAAPPDIAYPVFLTPAPDGTLFIGCDENGSLGREPNRGRIVRARDTDGDGRADEFKTFARMDSPRGVAWDQSTRTLYVMHPPNLTAYHDDNDTGVANREETLIAGLGFGLDFRGADHTTNGLRLGIDGWLYIAVGDYGAVKATGRDGRTLSLRGGGIVRVRPDGSGMELVSSGQRNILQVAISPELDLFTRDNTNDGDDWNVRLSHVPLGAHMGYPTLYRNFSDEIMPAMLDLGGGSPVGSIYIDEPSLPAEWRRGFYSVEWGRSEIALHPMAPAGATWKAESKVFAKVNRATDLEVDAAGRLYIASWEGAQFNYAGPNVGYVIQLTPNGARPPVPDFAKQSDAEVATLVGSPSATWRLAAQRELLKRAASSETITGLRAIVEGNPNRGARVAALFTLRQLLASGATPLLANYTRDPALQEFALKALADDRDITDVPSGPFLQGLESADPRVRLQAVTGLGRLGMSAAAPAMLRRTADADPTVAHIAVQSLRALGASDACFAALDGSDETLHRGALRVLQALHEPAVVEGLLRRAEKATGEKRLGILTALARLDHQEAPYTDPKMWWGTRPDTSGPLFKAERWAQSDRIEAALKQQLDASSGAEALRLVQVLVRTKVDFPGLTEAMLAKAGDDTATRLDLIAPMISPKTPVAPNLLAILRGIAVDTREPATLRARALRLMAGTAERNLEPVAATLAAVHTTGAPAEVEAVWEEFTRDSRHARRAKAFAELARSDDAAQRGLAATVLVNLASARIGVETKQKQGVNTSLRDLWSKPESAVALLEAIGQARAVGFRADVDARVNDANPAVAQAARAAAAQLAAATAAVGDTKPIGKAAFPDVLAAVASVPGDPVRGRELFLQRGCFACHTVSTTEPPKGPSLAGIAKRYSRAELVESILRPNAKLAQGFESQHFVLRNGSEVEGFVVREAGERVEVRNLAGVTTEIEKSDITKREKREGSIMPEGLLDGASMDDVAALLAYLESTQG